MQQQGDIEIGENFVTLWSESLGLGGSATYHK